MSNNYPFKEFNDEFSGNNNQEQFNDNEEDIDNKQVNLQNIKPLNEQIRYDDASNENKNNSSNQSAPNVTDQISNTTITQINTSLGFIGRYFNVEIKDVLDRLKSAMIPFNKSFYQTAEKNPDLYGPLWVYTTIVFVITVASNISGYLGVSNSDLTYINR